MCDINHLRFCCIKFVCAQVSWNVIIAWQCLIYSVFSDCSCCMTCVVIDVCWYVFLFIPIQSVLVTHYWSDLLICWFVTSVSVTLAASLVQHAIVFIVICCNNIIIVVKLCHVLLLYILLSGTLNHTIPLYCISHVQWRRQRSIGARSFRGQNLEPGHPDPLFSSKKVDDPFFSRRRQNTKVANAAEIVLLSK